MLRTSLVLVLGSLTVGCMVGDSGDGDGGDEAGATCGDGVKQASEACDDGNSSGGDGCSATCTVEAQPRLDMVVDKANIATELKTTNQVTVTLVGSGGFSGPVTLTATAVDANNVAIPGWTVALDKATVNVPVDGSADAVATLTVPSENRGLVGSIKVDATSSLGAKQTVTAIAVTNQVSLEVTMNGGLCVYTGVMGQTRVSVGTKIRMVNKGADNMIFHSDGGGRGVPHQDVGGGGSAPNAAYETTVTSAGNAFNWYCHSPGPNPGAQVQILPVAAQ